MDLATLAEYEVGPFITHSGRLRAQASTGGDMFKNIIRTLGAGAVALALTTGFASASPDKPVIGVVVKIGGIPWFNAMEAGIKKRADQLGVKAFLDGPTSAEPALQGRAIEDLIAQPVDDIVGGPKYEHVYEPVPLRSRASGTNAIPHNTTH